MGKLYFERICIFISSLVLMCRAAEQQYFLHDWRNLTWHEASTRCQVCFKELVTVTPENIKTISQNLTSDCWVGLRKNFPSTGDSRMSWSRWADGEPLIFQNWYPGWPVFKSSPPKTVCCCPAAKTAAMTAPTTTITLPGFTQLNGQPTTAAPTMPVEASCVRSPALSPDVPETTMNYIEDSCVAMLSFGAWVEKNCSELLPFICYDERFFGQADVTKITPESAVLTWLPAPGDIEHYRVEVKVDEERKQFQTNNLTSDLVNLTAGSRCSVQVFPVKCKRDLDPQEIAFYTTPNKVGNLTVTKVTETSVFLSWNKPAGNVAFYLIEVQGGQQITNKNEGKEVGSLTPGNMYTFTVLSGVEDNSTWSEESNVTTYTKPGKVSDLKVSENNVSSLLLNWVPPAGNTTGFRVMATSNRTLFNESVSQTEVRVTPLPAGTEVTLSVTALTANNTLEGDKVTVVSYTAPGPVSNLTLVTTFYSLTAEWKPSEGNFLSFTVELQLEGELVNTTHNLTEPRKHWDGLKTAANYTVIVSSVSGHLKGPSVAGSSFTGLSPPTDARVDSFDKNHIAFQWKAPDNIARARYSVRINASFWGHNRFYYVDDETHYRFDDLESGTKYDFEVRIVADEKSSSPAVVSHCTVAEKRELSLSMSCSSAQSLLCDEHATRESVFNQLNTHFDELLGDNIFWNLEKQETEKEGTQEA